jgi:hypothetical protein
MSLPIDQRAGSGIGVHRLENKNGDLDFFGIALQFPPDAFYPNGLTVTAHARIEPGIVDPAVCKDWAARLLDQIVRPRLPDGSPNLQMSTREFEHRRRIGNINWASVAAAVQRHIQDFNAKRQQAALLAANPFGTA